MRKKRRTHLEYRLFILPSFSQATKKPSRLFRLETVKEFANFTYEIAADEMIVGNSIVWKIRGLRSPEISLPASGPARFTKMYDSLKGVYEFTITKLDGGENTFTINFLDRSTSVIKAPKQKFIEIITSTDELTPTGKRS